MFLRRQCMIGQPRGGVELARRYRSNSIVNRRSAMMSLARIDVLHQGGSVENSIPGRHPTLVHTQRLSAHQMSYTLIH